MRELKRDYTVNISSEAGVFFYDGMVPYIASKHALRVLTELVEEENQEFVASRPGRFVRVLWIPRWQEPRGYANDR